MQLFLFTKGYCLGMFLLQQHVQSFTDYSFAQHMRFFSSDASSCSILNELFDFWALSIDCFWLIHSERLPALSSWAFSLDEIVVPDSVWFLLLYFFPVLKWFFRYSDIQVHLNRESTWWGKTRQNTTHFALEFAPLIWRGFFWVIFMLSPFCLH